MSNFKDGDVVIVGKNFAEALDKYYWPRKGLDLIGTKVTLERFVEYEEPSWHSRENPNWYIPESCLSPLKVVEEYI